MGGRRDKPKAKPAPGPAIVDMPTVGTSAQEQYIERVTEALDHTDPADMSIADYVGALEEIGASVEIRLQAAREDLKAFLNAPFVHWKTEPAEPTTSDAPASAKRDRARKSGKRSKR